MVTTELTLPTVSRLPALSPSLAAAVDAELYRPPAHADLGKQPRAPLPPALIAEAARIAQHAQSAMCPASGEAIMAWIQPLNHGCRNPQQPRELAVWANAVAFAAYKIPAQTLTADALRDLMARSAFFPSAADVLAVLQPEANRIRAKVRALSAIASSPVQGATPEAPCATRKALEDASNSRLVAALKVTVAASERGARSASSAYQTTEQRIRAYRAIGQNDTADRIAAAYGIAP